MKAWRIVLVALLALACGSGGAGCNSAHREATEALGAADAAPAVLRADVGATIVAVDGKNVPSGDVANLRGDQIVRVAAGARKVGVYTTGRGGAGEWTVPLTAESGHEYRFAPASAAAVSLRVVDETTGNVLIGGRYPAAAVPAPLSAGAAVGVGGRAGTVTALPPPAPSSVGR